MDDFGNEQVTDHPDSDEERRGRGREKGCAKPEGSGRQPGTLNKLRQSGKEMIAVRGRPLDLLCAITAGRRVKVADPADPTKTIWIYPSMAERRAAASDLLRKVIPDVKAQEVSGPEGEPVETIRRIIVDPAAAVADMTPAEKAQRLAAILQMTRQAVGDDVAEAFREPPPMTGKGVRVVGGQPVKNDSEVEE
jgi:hypothetical protein